MIEIIKKVEIGRNGGHRAVEYEGFKLDTEGRWCSLPAVATGVFVMGIFVAGIATGILATGIFVTKLVAMVTSIIAIALVAVIVSTIAVNVVVRTRLLGRT